MTHMFEDHDAGEEGEEETIVLVVAQASPTVAVTPMHDSAIKLLRLHKTKALAGMSNVAARLNR